MHAGDSITNELIGLIYETAQEPNLWPILLEGLTAATEESDSHFIPYQSRQRINAAQPVGIIENELHGKKTVSHGEITQTLIPHFQRALKINKQIAELKEERDSVASVLEDLPIGILLVRDDGTVLNMNYFARQLINKRDILAIENDRLKCLDNFSDKKLEKIISQATAKHEQKANTFSIQNDENKNIFSMYIAPAKSEITEPLQGNVCSVFIAVADTSKSVSSQGLKEVFGLTPAEIRIAQYLVKGKTIDEAAEEFNVSLNTIKSQLKSVFTKTGTQRQAELVSELLANPALLVKNHYQVAPVYNEKVNISVLNDQDYTETKIILKDGRILACAEFGDPDGKPVLFFHNMLSSRLQYPLDSSKLKKMGVRLICPDRHGFGKSSLFPGKTLETTADDIAELTTRLGIKKYYVLGHSTGGPHAAACACYYPGQCVRAGLISSMVPFKSVTELNWMRASDKLLMGMARHTPKLLMPFLKAVGSSMIKSPENFILRYTSNWFDGDIELLKKGSVLQDWSNSLKEGIRQGVEGIYEEIFLMARPWGFDLSTVQAETLIWHGEADNSVDLSFANNLTKIPGSRMTTYPGEGHLIIINHFEEMLAELISE